MLEALFGCLAIDRLWRLPLLPLIRGKYETRPVSGIVASERGGRRPGGILGRGSKNDLTLTGLARPVRAVISGCRYATPVSRQVGDMRVITAAIATGRITSPFI